ncbi:hypothetical protein IM538_20925 [Cytobacillus suaedae]|nr:hypothetical protein IM538_20925 [Cytobacillus suaedae]
MKKLGILLLFGCMLLVGCSTKENPYLVKWEITNQSLATVILTDEQGDYLNVMYTFKVKNKSNETLKIETIEPKVKESMKSLSKKSDITLEVGKSIQPLKDIKLKII